jgi:hypothetical protein
MAEVADHPWFIGSQFHPELRSRPTRPHPLFREFVHAALASREGSAAAAAGAPAAARGGAPARDAVPAGTSRSRAAVRSAAPSPLQPAREPLAG